MEDDRACRHPHRVHAVIVTGVVLGIARVAGETAPLLILVGYTPEPRTPTCSTAPRDSLPGLHQRDQFINYNTPRQGTDVLTWTRTASRSWARSPTSPC